MSNIPQNLKYTEKHEWVKIENDIATIGITDFAQEKLGDIVFVDLPQIDDEVKQDEELCVIESVKAASDIYSPISGIIRESNETLEDSPETINQSPYEDGWITKVKDFDPNELDNLLSSEEYKNFIA